MVRGIALTDTVTTGAGSVWSNVEVDGGRESAGDTRL